MLFLKNEEQPSEKTSEQYFSGKTKSTCQNSAIFEHFQKCLKKLGELLACSLSFIDVSAKKPDEQKNKEDKQTLAELSSAQKYKSNCSCSLVPYNEHLINQA